MSPTSSLTRAIHYRTRLCISTRTLGKQSIGWLKSLGYDGNGGEDMEAVAEDEDMEGEKDDGFIKYDGNEEEEDDEESEADTSYQLPLETNLFD